MKLKDLLFVTCGDAPPVQVHLIISRCVCVYRCVKINKKLVEIFSLKKETGSLCSKYTKLSEGADGWVS